MNGLRAIIVTVIMLTASQAHATTQAFNIYFDETPGSVFEQTNWQGTYTLTDGKIAAFSAFIGDCHIWGAPFCTFFQLPHPNSPPLDDPQADCCGGFVAAFGGPRLSYSGGAWTTVNSQDFIFQRFGVYRAELASIPEPQGVWMLAMVILGLRWAFGRYRKLS